MSSSPPTAAPPKVAFAAFQNRGYRLYFATYVMAMMADNVEHVISYWMAFQKFHSPALGGFAVLAHWLPFLFFALPVGSFAERHDPRRVIQIGMAMFMAASLGWGFFFVTDTLQLWHAMVLLVLHGCAGVLWQTTSQLLLHEIVGPALLPSAVRLTATARSLGVLVGPAVGGLLMLTAGPIWGIFLNVLFYVPLVLWLWKAPYGPKFRSGKAVPPRPVKGFGDVARTIRDIAPHKTLVSMIALAGLASFFIGNGYQAQMPGLAADLGHGDPGTLYSMLLAADAAGAITAGFVLEGRNLMPASPRLAVMLAMAWALSLAAFAASSSYPLSLLLLFAAGFFELSFSSMAQALVQINAPADMRGRVIGLFNMAALGLRAFAGITIGLFGSLVGVHWSLALSGGVLVAVLGVLLMRMGTAPAWFAAGGASSSPPSPSSPSSSSPAGRGDAQAAPATTRQLDQVDLQLALLTLLADGPRHGHELVDAMDRRHGAESPGPAGVYPALAYLADLGQVAIQIDGTRRRYALAAGGLARLEPLRDLPDDRRRPVPAALRGTQAADAPEPGSNDRLNAALRGFKAALAARRGASAAERDRLAKIVRQAARDISRD